MFAFCLSLAFQTISAPTDTNAVLSTWIAAQANIHTWSADVVQTRTLKSLTQPLTAKGHVWFEAPNRFRWELGNPPQTIAVRGPEEMLVIYPRLKHAERYALGGDQSGGAGPDDGHIGRHGRLLSGSRGCERS